MKNRVGFYFFPKRRKGNEEWESVKYFVKRIKQSQADVTEFWKRVEQGEKERKGRRRRNL